MKLRSIKYMFITIVVLAAAVPERPLYGGDENGPARFGHTVLALYKSSDGYKENNNPVAWWFAPDLRKMGFKVVYHDFDSGLPSPGSDVRAVMSWYNSGLVKSKSVALDYAAFLNRAIGSGRKVIILNSFGAYGYKEGGNEKWDLAPRLAPLFNRLGFSFRGNWTSDYKRLKIVSKESGMVEHGGTISLAAAKHYQQIVPVREDVTSYLIVRRTDRVKGAGDGNSSVIFTSKNGGFAMEQYVMQKNKLLLNPAAFMKRALFYDDGYQDAGIIVGDVADSARVKQNLDFACAYAKIRHSLIDIREINNMVGNDLASFEVLVVATGSVDRLSPAVLEGYVKQGGKLIFINAVKDAGRLKNLLGIGAYDSSYTIIKKGFSEMPGFYVNYLAKRGQGVPVDVRKTTLLKGSKVLISARVSGKKADYPVLWERTFGRGRVLYWNTRLLLSGKAFRGTVVQSIQYLHSGYVTGLANVGMIMIDDFPAPLWNLNYRAYRIKYYTEQIAKTDNPARKKALQIILARLKKYPEQTDTSFVSTTWFNDTLAMAKKFGFRYSTFLIFNYNRETGRKGPGFEIKDFYLAQGNAPYKMGLRVLEQGWDFGFHGFNHMSLTTKRPEEYDSAPWPDRKSMEKALSLAYREWIKLYGKENLPISYVAPHNIIDDTGLKALGSAFPSIQVVSTLYMGGKDERSQEFRWTRDRRFFQIPRITSGYSLSDTGFVLLYDVLHNMGVVSHFVHPDDAFDEHRSFGFNGWNWMKKQFTDDFGRIMKDFPWLRWMTVRDAFSEFLFYNNTHLKVRQAGKKIIVTSTDGSDKYLFFRLRLAKGQRLGKLENCVKVHHYKKTNDFIFKTNQHRSVIHTR